MNQKILVAYATKAGSTAEVAARIGETLSKRGLSVDVRPVKEAKDLGAYSTVIVGSAIRVGQVLPEAKKFIEAHGGDLKQKNFSVFCVCMTLEKDNEETRKTVSAFLDPVRALVQPVSEGMFAGAVDPQKLGLVERMMTRAVKVPVGDYRKWDLIEAWAESVPVA